MLELCHYVLFQAIRVYDLVKEWFPHSTKTLPVGCKIPSHLLVLGESGRVPWPFEVNMIIDYCKTVGIPQLSILFNAAEPPPIHYSPIKSNYSNRTIQEPSSFIAGECSSTPSKPLQGKEILIDELVKILLERKDITLRIGNNSIQGSETLERSIQGSETLKLSLLFGDQLEHFCTTLQQLAQAGESHLKALPESSPIDLLISTQKRLDLTGTPALALAFAQIIHQPRSDFITREALDYATFKYATCKQNFGK